jgi:hypothetical protein
VHDDARAVGGEHVRRDRPALQLVRLAVPEEVRRLVPDTTYFWLHARRLTAEGVRSLL